MADAFWAYGAEVRIGDGGTPTETFTAIPGVEDITGPEFNRNIIEYFTHSSPQGYIQRKGAARDSGTVTFDVIWQGDDATQNALQTAYAADETTNFQVFVPDIVANNRFSFAAYVSAMSAALPTQELYRRSVTLQISGPITVSTE